MTRESTATKAEDADQAGAEPTVPADAMCASHPSTRATGICSRCGRFGCDGCMVWPGTNCRECATRAVVEPRRLGGWLILALVGLFAFPLVFLSRVAAIVAYAIDGTIVAALEQDPGWIGLLTVDGLATAGLAGFALFILPKFWSKNRRVPMLMIGLFGANFAWGIVDLIIGSFHSAATPSANPTADVIRSCVITGLWISYFQKSRRVRETFIR